jgi:hypothetical protein
VRQDILSSLKLLDPAVLTSSFNRPNIHYSILLLDVQPPPDHPTALSTKFVTAAAAAAAAGPVGGVGLGSSSRMYDVGDTDEVVDDTDHAGYAHLLQLLKPAGLASRNQQAAKRQQQQQEGQRQWPGPIAIVYALKR